MELSEYTKRFLEFEENNNMFNKKINGIEYWVYLRFEVFYCLANLFHLGYSGKDNGIYKKMELEFNNTRNYFNQIFCNQNNVKQKDILIIPDRRLFQIGKKYRCIYTDYLEKNIKKKYCVLSFGDFQCNTNIKLNFKKYYFVNLEKFQKVRNLSINTFSRINTEVFFREVIFPIEQAFGIEVNQNIAFGWMESLYSKLSRYELYTRYYEWILDKVNPKVILFTDYYCYYHMILCEVAKERKIPVIELQHGIVNKYHISYNFPKMSFVKQFPDYFFSFGLKEKQVDMPIDKKRIIPVGFPEIEVEKKNDKMFCKDKPTILVVSSVDIELAKVAVKLYELLGDEYDYIYKLHPLEIAEWKNTVGELFQNTPYKVIDRMDKTIHHYLNIADWVIGTGSTSLFEATYFGCKIVVQKIREYEICEELYENGYALLAEDVNDLADIIKKNEFIPKKDDFFYMNNSLDNMIRAIDNIFWGKI